MQRERASAMRTGLAQLATALSLLMVLCLGCSIQTPQTCTNCGSAAGLDVAPQRFAFFPGAEGGLTPGTYRSDVIPRQAGNLVIEAFPVQAGTATALVLDAPIGGSPTQNTDSASAGPPLTTYTKWQVRGVLPTVQLKVVVTSGLWTFFGTFTDVATTVARAAYYDRNPTNVSLSAAGSHTGTDQISFTFNTGSIQYVVPANRKAQITSWYVRVMRTAVAGTPDSANCWLQTGNTLFGYAEIRTNAVGDHDESFGGLGPIILAGESVTNFVQDLSTYGAGSGVQYRLAATIFEFDA